MNHVKTTGRLSIRHKLMLLAVTLLVAAACIGLNLQTAYASEGDVFASGSGTEADPYVINTADQLAAFATSVDGETTYADKYIALGEDIDLSGVENWNPIGAEGKASSNKTKLFAGNFDGQGHVISGMKISGEYGSIVNIGLFSTLAGTARVSNLRLRGINIDVSESGNSWDDAINVGGISGGTQSASPRASVIDNCYVAGNINVHSSHVKATGGGILGLAFTRSAIINCVTETVVSVTTATTNAGANAGGIAGTTGNYTVMANCTSFGDVTAENISGGADAYAGGLTGMLTSTIYNCYATGDATITQKAGVKKQFVGALAGQQAASPGGSMNYYGSDVKLTVKDEAGNETPINARPWSTDEMNGHATAEAAMSVADMATEAFANTLNTNNSAVTTNLNEPALQPHAWKLTGGKVIPMDIELPGEADNSGYVLMNIPYDKFYAGEEARVDAVSTATIKAYNTNKAAGTYHDGYIATDEANGTTVRGVTYPVFVSDKSVLSGFKAITSESSEELTVVKRENNKNTLVKETKTGKDVLFGSGDYAYYALDQKPAMYKTLKLDDAGDISFSAASEENTSASAEIAVSYGGHHADVTLSVKDEEHLTGVTVNGVTLRASDNNVYALQHVSQIWAANEIGWNWNQLSDGLSGKTISSIVYYVNDEKGNYAAYEYSPKNLLIKKNSASDATAAFNGLSSVKITGLPEDIVSPKATVQTVVGRGETPTVIADAVAVADGTITLTTAAANNTNYSITIVSDNYADINATATAPAASSPGGTGGSGGSGGAVVQPTNPTTELNNAITDAKAIAADGYTADSYKALTDAIEAAEKIAADPNATDQQKKDAAVAVAAAKAGLVTSGGKPDPQPPADDSTVKPGDTQIVADQEYGVLVTDTDAAEGTVTLNKAKDGKSVTIPATVKLADGKTYKVTAIASGAFAGSKATKVTVGKNVKKLSKNAFGKSKVKTIVIKTKKLTKASIKGSLKGSKVTTVKVKVGSKKANKKYVKKYKKIFSKKIAGKKVRVK